MVPISKKTAECFRTGGGPGEERRPVGKRHAFLWKAAAEKSGGTRLLDYVDLHTYFSYTGTTNLAFSTAGDTSVQQARMNSTRVSWDPAYTDPFSTAELHDRCELHRKLYHRASAGAAGDSDDEGLGCQGLSGHQAGDHGVQLGRAGAQLTAPWRRPMCWASLAARGWISARCGDRRIRPGKCRA